MGKSALAAQLAHRLASDADLIPGGVLWIDFLNSGKQPHEAASSWLRMYDPQFSTDGLSPQDLLQQFRALARERRPLIVLDNVVDRQQVEALLVEEPGVVTLITTRDARAIPVQVNSHTVDKLSQADALAMLEILAEEKIAANRAVAEQICQQCGCLPIFLKAAGAALKGRKFRRARDYADELPRRGLDALAEHDDNAAVVFDLSWEALDEPQQQTLAILSQFPGPTVDAGFVTAWFAAGGTPLDEDQAWKLLVALQENAGMLDDASVGASDDASEEDADRFRLHDRVRDYAAGKLLSCFGPDRAFAVDRSRSRSSAGHVSWATWQSVELGFELATRLRYCWSDWDFVAAELAAVGAHDLVLQYHVLQQRTDVRPDGGDAQEESSQVWSDFELWRDFIRGQAHVLDHWPELFFQQAYKDAVESPISREVQRRAADGKCPQRFLEWTNRPQEYAPPACLQVLSGHDSFVSEAAFPSDGRRVVSGSDDKTVRVWDLESGRCTAVLEGHTGGVQSVALDDGRRAVSGQTCDVLGSHEDDK